VYVYVCREKKRDEKQGAVFAVLLKRFKNNIYLSIYPYIYMYIYREEQEEGETRGGRSASPRNNGRESKAQ